MNWSKYKGMVSAVVLMLFCLVAVRAQVSAPLNEGVPALSALGREGVSLLQDTVVKRVKPAKGTPEYYEYKVESYNRFWRGLIPNQARTQYAGSVGMINLGLGWHYGGKERHRWETDFMFGLILKNNNPHNYLTFTLRQSYVPFRIPLMWNLSYEPLATGLMLNFISGEEFWMREPSKYPQRYYGFPTAVRSHIFLGQRIRWEIPHAKRKYVKAISFCYDFSACDLDMASYFTNSYIKLRDILSLSLGVKVEAF